MYTSFYGFDKKPFSINPDPESLYLSPDHQEALAHLEYALLSKIGLMMLTGDVGTGKTTILRYTVDNFCDDKQIAAIFQTNVSPKELFRLILSGFGIEVRGDHKDQQLGALKRFLNIMQQDEQQALVIVDESQGLSDEALEEIRLLTNIQMEYPDAMQILLVGQPEFLERLQSPQWLSLGQRIGINYHLKPLDFAQTCWYIAHRLTKVGGRLKLFSKDALKQIFKSSGGTPRLINLICDAALIYGYGDELKTIKAPLIEKVVEERAGMGLQCGLNPLNISKNGQTEIAAEGPFKDRLELIEEELVQIHNQLDCQREDLSILSSSSKSDLQTLVKKILAKERRKRRYMEDEIKLLRKSLKKAGITHKDTVRKVPDATKSTPEPKQELTRRHLSVK
jgi:type II secretory pathway predicted ATPase ExeA